jgi:hypothetical protein
MRTRLYGVSIELTPDIDGLPRLVSGGPPDLTITLGSRPTSFSEETYAPEALWYVGPYLDANGRPELSIVRLPDGGLWVRYADGVSFQIDRGLDLIRGWWLPPRELGDAVGYLLGPVLGLLLRLRNCVCMHAGGVVIAGSTALLVGAEGAGKSTMTAALVQRGHSFLTDDIAPLHETSEGIVVQPGVPRIFLEPGSVRALNVPLERVDRQSVTWGKSFLRCLPTDLNWSRDAPPLNVIYLLKRDDARRLPPSCQRLEGCHAMAGIVAHTYANRTLDAKRRTDEFRFLSRMLERVRVVEVHFPGGFHHLNDVCRTIELDVSHVGVPCTASPITAT